MPSIPSQARLALDGSAEHHSPPAATLLLDGMRPEPGAWDELRAGDGRLRELWRDFAGHLDGDVATLAGGLDRRLAQLARQILDDGITHNVFGAQGAAPRPWSLELLPLLIGPSDWAAIEAGVRQRAALMQALLADAYGPQRLLHEGLLPPALLLRHPGYLRAMRGVVPASGWHLHVVAFDLARRPDGQWQVAARRCQGPSGLGYVLHNRMLVSRQFPDAFRELRVQHIGSSYRRLLDAIEAPARALAGGHPPRVVLLTPGPYSETYFEHAYLARYLGLPLVEGGDLLVREQRLFIRTVEGLEPVHGMLRRLDDEWCDPLELRADSTLGVPGLLQVLRAGHLVMANAPGSGFLESPALQGFLPAIARRLLGEELRLPGLPSWWCGEAAAWQDVQGQLDDKVLRSTYPRAGRVSATTEPDAAVIGGDPDAWTVTERIRLSRAPVWCDGRVQVRPAMVRVYAIADGRGQWHVLPGGMTRVAQRDGHSVSMQRGGSSLDTWVVTGGPVDDFSMLPARLSVDDIAQRRAPVPSRAAENLFWLGRYTERTEQQLRLAREVLLQAEDDTPALAPLRAALSALAQQVGLVAPGTPTLNQSPRLAERALLAALVDPDSGSLAFNLAALRRAAAVLRERLSPEHWRVLQAMSDGLATLGAGDDVSPLPSIPKVRAALDPLAVQLAAVTGAQTDRMTRDHGWRFLTAGRLIERLIGLGATMAEFAAHGALRTAPGMARLLELFDSAITYRARYQRHEDLLALTDLLVLDNTNPRALAGVLRRLRTELSKLPGGEATTLALLGRLPAEGAGMALDDLRGLAEPALVQRLESLARGLHQSGRDLADALGHRYFSHAHAGDELQRV